MRSLDPDDCRHTTADIYPGLTQDPVGIDLFDEEFDGEIQTVIYQRFADGRRWPARTVTHTDPEHHTRVIDAWAAKGVLNDYRVKFSR